MDRPVRLLVGATVVAGPLGALLTVRAYWSAGLGDGRLLVLALLGLALANVYRIRFFWRGESEQLSVDEVFVVVLVMCSTPNAVLLAVVLATVFGSLRFRLPLMKLLFNAGSFSLAASLALQVTVWVAGGVPTGHGPRGLAAAALGVVTMHGLETVMVRVAVALSSRLPFLSLFERFSLLETVFLTSAVSVGLLAGIAAAEHPVQMLLVMPPLGVIVFVLNEHAQVMRERQRLDQLLETAISANRAVGVPGVCEVLVEAAQSMLNTHEARVQEHPPEEGELGSAIQADGRVLWLVARAEAAGPEGAGMLDGIAAIGTGAVGSVELLDRVRHQAFHDALTGLPNRVLFEDRVNQALRRARQRSAAVLLVDLDRFQRVNDSLGHASGDALLRLVAARVVGELRSFDSVARVGGDEFAVLLTELGSEEEAAEYGEQLAAALRRPYLVDGREVVVTASVGVASYLVDGADFDTLLRAADAAMHTAKELGRNAVQRGMVRKRAEGGLALESDLRRALEQDQLWVAYQPQVALASMAVVGAEALVRWTHPTRGLMRPDEFLGLAAEIGLLTTIDEWVLDEVCRQNAVWRRAGVGPLCVAVNLSSGPLRAGRIHDLVVNALHRHALPADGLELEVTEQVVAMVDEASIDALSGLRLLGVRVAIDDFGTGYSSLSRLRTLPVDVVKIDQSFVREITDGGSAVPLVTGTIGMAHGLGLEVLAEGVETAEQLRFLTDKQCEMAQGYLLGRPVPADTFAGLVATPVEASFLRPGTRRSAQK